jgi:hypothetical protein
MTTHAFVKNEANQVKNLDNFYIHDKESRISKTIAYYKPFLGKTQYFTCVLRTQEAKKNQPAQEWLEPIFRTDDLDSAIFVWNNTYLFDMLKRAKNYRNDLLTENDLDKKIEDRFKSEKRKFNAKSLSVNIISDNDDFVGASEPTIYIPLGQRPNVLDRITQNLIEAFC